MECGHFELFSRNGLAAEVAVYYYSWALELDVPSDSFKSFDLFEATEALNLKALTFVLEMLLQIIKVNLLLHLAFLTSVHYFYLTEHLQQEFVFD